MGARLAAMRPFLWVALSLKSAAKSETGMMKGFKPEKYAS